MNRSLTRVMPKLSFQYVRQELTETLLEFLVRRFRYHDAETWEQRIAGGHVSVNGRAGKPDRVLETRDRIVYDRPPGPEPPVDTRYRVLYEDGELLAVSKSGNIPTSPSGKYWTNCLVHHLQTERNLPELRAVHRLDRETSGVNLFAKNRVAARVLGEDFQAGRVRKVYAAIVHGAFPAGETYVHAPLRDARSGAVRIRQEAHPSGRPATTRFRLQEPLEAPGGGAASLVRAEPVTGRTHQIRAHVALLGHPVWGDKLYGGSEESFIAWVQDGPRTAETRQLLHASELSFIDPASGREITIKDPAEVLVDLLMEGMDGCGVVGE